MIKKYSRMPERPILGQDNNFGSEAACLTCLLSHILASLGKGMCGKYILQLFNAYLIILVTL